MLWSEVRRDPTLLFPLGAVGQYLTRRSRWFYERNYCWQKNPPSAVVVFFLVFKDGKDFGKRASYLQPGSETELNNVNFNETRNENTKNIETK